jgi:hypothetical protein
MLPWTSGHPRSPLGNGKTPRSSSEEFSAAAGKVYPREPFQA